VTPASLKNDAPVPPVERLNLVDRHSRVVFI
jgi:hypothetical protein